MGSVDNERPRRRKVTPHPRGRVPGQESTSQGPAPPPSKTPKGKNSTRVKRQPIKRKDGKESNQRGRTKSTKRKGGKAPADTPNHAPPPRQQGHGDEMEVDDENEDEPGHGNLTHVTHHTHPFDRMVADEYFDEINWIDDESDESEEEDSADEVIDPSIFSHPRPTKFRPHPRARARRPILVHRTGRYPSHDPTQPSHRHIQFATVVKVTYWRCDLSKAYRRVRKYGRVGLYDASKRPRTA